MELWDTTPEDVRDALRPVDYTEVYPPCGCDPATTPLRYLDLMAEAAVAGRLGGERERALKIAKRALHLLEDDGDPLRAAWFWVQRSHLVQGLARGDGWTELAAAEELVRGLPPSEVHAEVLYNFANWSMLHCPGPEAVTAAERAVEYARMVGAREIEMNACVTNAGLAVESGDVDTGLAEMFEILRQTLDDGLSAVARPRLREPAERPRSHRPLPGSRPDPGGRTRLRPDARHVRQGGLDLGQSRRVPLLPGPLGPGGRGRRPGRTHRPRRPAPRLPRGQPGHARPRPRRPPRGRTPTHRGPRLLRLPRPDPATRPPLSDLAIGIAAAEGRLLDARADLERVLDTGFPPGTQRYAWPLLLTAATTEADSLGLPVAEQGRAKILDRIREAARPLATNAPVWLAHERWLRAELLRAESADTPDHWSEAVTAFEPLERPYDLARVRHRLAQALLSAPGGAEQPDRDRATELLRLAHAAAEHLGARPLADAVGLLAQRARLTLTAERAPAPDDPARSLGLTGRERDVLRLVALGRTNRQIAGELFISPKTASVHVSNILAKLAVSGRGEAAAVAHRLGLFPQEALQVPITE